MNMWVHLLRICWRHCELIPGWQVALRRFENRHVLRRNVLQWPCERNSLVLLACAPMKRDRYGHQDILCYHFIEGIMFDYLVILIALFQVTAKSTLLMEDLGEETGLVCVICREGYKFQPTKVLGVYTFTKRCNVEEFEAKPRKTVGYSTVTHFNVVHVDCHMAAVRWVKDFM